MSSVISSLKFMQRMERLATNLYRRQISSFSGTDISNIMQKAHENEKEHVEILTKDLSRLKQSPPKTGILFSFAGGTAGMITRFTGKKNLLKVDSWIERMAVRDYTRFLAKHKFDAESAGMITRIIEDENRHIANWGSSIEALEKK